MSYCKKCYLEKLNPEAKAENFVYTDEPAKCECCGKNRLLVQYYENDEDYMSIAECNVATRDHIDKVRYFIKLITDELTIRGMNHDLSKLTSPEVEIFAKHTKKLARLKFQNENGEVSDEYKASLDAIKEATTHHYAVNRHHPEHYPNGINGMDLVDIVEMLCDWKAASLRQHDGNLLKSIEANAKRFNINKQLLEILLNTAKLIDREVV